MKAPNLLDRAPGDVARALALELLEKAAAAATRLEAGERDDALHAFRVAVRRLRTLLEAHREFLEETVSKKHVRALHRLADDTGDARDAEVQLAWLAEHGAELAPRGRGAASWLAQRLSERREEAHEALRDEVLPRFRKLEKRLSRRLSRVETAGTPGASGPTFARALSELLRGASAKLVRSLAAVNDATDVEAAHRSRLRAKRLRYRIEPLEHTSLRRPARRALRALEELQDLLGGLHDAHVLSAQLADALVDAAGARARRQHEALYSPDGSRPEKDLGPGLLAIDRLVRDRARGLFEELDARWSAERRSAFAEEVEGLATALDRRAARASRATSTRSRRNASSSRRGRQDQGTALHRRRSHASPRSSQR